MTGVSTAAKVLTARWLLPMSSPPVENGGIEIEGDRIVALHDERQLAKLKAEASESGKSIEDLGACIVVPAFINLHTHLDWTAQELFDTASPLFDWIPGLMRSARNWQAGDFHSSAAAGAARIAGSGTGCVLDSSYSGFAAQALCESGLRGTVGLELFGVDEGSTQAVWEKWLRRKEEVQARYRLSDRVRLSAAPHAPYTVSPALSRCALEHAAKEGVPFTMHVAESHQEVAWVHAGEPRVDQFLEGVHALPGGSVHNLSWRASGRTPVRMLCDEGLLSDSLVIAHACRLTDEDIDLLAAHNVKVAHCPRSNARLRNGIAPLRRLLEAGIVVGMGTDSAGSTDNLSVLSELRFAWNLHRACDPDFPFDSCEALKLITINGAKALGMSDLIGSLEPGKLADLAIFNVDSPGPWAHQRPYDALLYGKAVLQDLLIGGRKVSLDRLY